MDRYQKDIVSFQEKISKLNDYGVQVTFQKAEEGAVTSKRPDQKKKDHSDDETAEADSDYLVKEPTQSVRKAEQAKKNDTSCLPACHVNQRPKVSREFVLRPGLNVCLDGDDPIDYFRLMANEIMFENLLRETNKNLRDMREESGSENTEDATLLELLRFTGLLLHMGTIQLNRIVDYWNDDPLFDMSCFIRYMSRNRFMILLKCVKHTNLIQHFNAVMSKIYTAGRVLTVKEPLYYVGGRLRRKPSVIPDNCFTLNCVNEPSGIILKCVISNKTNENVISELLLELINANRSVYVVQTYSSVRLAHKLLDQATTCTGLLPNDTLRLANMVQEKPLIGIVQKGALIGRCKRDCTVFFSSEYTEMENIDEDSIPKALIEYNKYINDDKLRDELLAYYTCERRQMSLEKKLLIHLVQIMLMNAFYLNNNQNEVKKSTLYDFRLEVIRSLLDPDLSKWSGDRCSVASHRPSLLRQDSLGRQKRKKCNVCFYQKGIRQDTKYYCASCPHMPGLCLDSCFRTYHIHSDT